MWFLLFSLSSEQSSEMLLFISILGFLTLVKAENALFLFKDVRSWTWSVVPMSVLLGFAVTMDLPRLNAVNSLCSIAVLASWRIPSLDAPGWSGLWADNVVCCLSVLCRGGRLLTERIPFPGIVFCDLVVESWSGIAIDSGAIKE